MRQEVRGAVGDEPKVEMCAKCFEHRGADETMTARRTAEHDAMLRTRLATAERIAERAFSERDRALERMRAAFGSRDSAFRILQKVNDLHELRRDGSCSCGAKRNCRTAALVYGSWAQSMIGRLDRADAEEPDE